MTATSVTHSRTVLRISLGAVFACALFSPDRGHAQTTCLEDATKVESADRSQTDYDFDRADRAVDARAVHWIGTPGHALKLDGIKPACWIGGDVEGPYREDSVFACQWIHCPDNLCPCPCLAYHRTAGMRVDVEAPAIVEDLRVSDYGDGIERSEFANREPLIVKGVYLHDIHDDAIENDWGASITVLDSLLERVNTAFASRPRLGEVVDASDRIFEVRDSLVLLHSFPNSYLMRPGHGKFWKWPKDGTGPNTIVTGNTFVVTDYGDVGLLPLADQVLECADNALLWAASSSSFDDWIEDPEVGSDGLTPEGRAEALSDCFTFIVKPDAQSQADFLAEHFDPLVAVWKESHPVAVRAEPAGLACFDSFTNDLDSHIVPADFGCSVFTAGGSATDEDGDGHPPPCDCDDDDDSVFPYAPEVCNDRDDDCDGSVDEELGSQATSCGVGACAATGELLCIEGTVEDSCEAGRPASVDETCDAVDDDCDGSVDEEFEAEECDTGEPGVCAAGFTFCQAGDAICVQELEAERKDRVCDGLDEDCDGRVDENFREEECITGEPGVCAAGITSCQAGATLCVQETTAAPNDAVCNGLDDDCDGSVDEEYLSQS